MSLDEEMAWEDYQGFPRPTRQPYRCSKCGLKCHTRDIYLNHNCKPKPRQKSTFDRRREEQQMNSLAEFKRRHGIK